MNFHPKSILPMTTAAVCAAMFLPTEATAQRNVECGQPYTVVRGDSLSAIAQDAYGSPREYQIIYSANADAIGSNPGRINVGLRLQIPCLEQTADSTADLSNIRIERTAGVLPLPNQNMIRVTSGNNYEPFHNKDQEQGGMLVEMMNVALDQADGDPDYKIDFIDDWGAHLQPLIADHAYDFSISWFKPNCDNLELLGEGSQFRCNNLMFSDPLFEQIMGYFSRNDEAAVETHEDLFGKTICRPAGYSTFMMEEHRLVEPNITFVTPVTPQECFEQLTAGDVDYVAINIDVAEGAILELGIDDQVRNNDQLSQILTLHAVISNTHPRAEDYLETLNSGIRKIKDSGEWFEIVRRHLAEHRAKTQS